MATFKLTYKNDGTQLTLDPPAAADRTISIDDFDYISIKNDAGSDITIESIPRTCCAFANPSKLMRFKVKAGQTEVLALRPDLPSAFVSSGERLRLLWRAKSKDGFGDPTPLNPDNETKGWQIKIVKP